MNNTRILEEINCSAAVTVVLAELYPLSEFDEQTFVAREQALLCGKLKEWWDMFWHEFALSVARGGD